MTIAHACSPIVTPLKALWRWLMAAPGNAAVPANPISARARHTATASACATTLRTQVIKAQPCSGGRAALRKPVRVLQVIDAGQTPTQVGRLRISGRMADVCAELDRLAAREALLH